MSDLLLRSAKAYEEIMRSRYLFTLGWKGKLRQIEIYFPVFGYHHLAGFQYAKTVAQLSNKHSALRCVLNQEVTERTLKEEGVFDAIRDRICAICDLKRVIESNRIVFYFRGKASQWSRIEADYLIKYATSDLHDSPMPYSANGDIHFFLNGKDGMYVPASIFVREDQDYWKNCPKLTVLEITEIKDQQSRIVYSSPTYIKD